MHMEHLCPISKKQADRIIALNQILTILANYKSGCSVQ